MSLPLAAAIVVGATAVAVLLMATVRRRVAAPLVNEPARATPMMTFVGTAFAVLLAFITLAAFQTYNGAKTGAATEAVAVFDMFKSASFFPISERDELRADFVCYGRAVMHHEWPAMRRGQRAQLVDAWISAYRTAFERLTLRAAAQRLGLQDLLASARDRTDGRRDRLSEATPSVPTPLWVGLVVAGCIAVVIQLVLADPREHMLVQSVMIGGVAAMVSIGLLLINFLDHPYRSGPGSIQPMEMTATLTMMREQEPALRLPRRRRPLPRLIAPAYDRSPGHAHNALARAEPRTHPRVGRVPRPSTLSRSAALPPVCVVPRFGPRRARAAAPSPRPPGAT